MSKKVHGHKDFFSTFSFVFTGIAVLVGLNVGLFVVLIKYPQWKRYFFVGLAVLIRVLWRMRRIQKGLRYIFDKQGITIHLPGGKEFFLAKKDIESKEHIDSLPWFSGWGIKYIPRKNELHFTTSTSHILKITMQDGRIIFLSPKEYPKK